MATPKKSAKKAPGRTQAAKTAKRAVKKPPKARQVAGKKAPATKAVPDKKRPDKKRPEKKQPGEKQGARKATALKRTPKKPVAAKPSPTRKATPESKGRRPLLDRKPAARKAGTVICPLSGFTVSPQRANLSPRTIERLRRKLVDERERHLRQAEELQAEAEALALERDQGDTQFDEESGEGDTVNVERERDLLLSASARQIVEAVDRALQRMDKDTYGVCVPAGRRIAVERLEAIPYAEECVECKARAERRR
jgi:RNA polymerase-binding transcription factor DksA